MDKLRKRTLVGKLTRPFLALAAAPFLLAGMVACGGDAAQSLLEGLGGAESEAVRTDVAASIPQQIEVDARLHFPRRQELTFERSGEVAEVLVNPGDVVREGQLLARLNSDHFPILEEETVRLRHQITEAREAIRVIRLGAAAEPVLEAQREENVARLELATTHAEDLIEDIDQIHSDRLTAARSEQDQARIALDLASDALADAHRDLDANQVLVIAAAEQAQAQAELALDQATEQLKDYREDLDDGAVLAGDRVTAAEGVLDRAVEGLADYQEDLEQNEVRARDLVSQAELALDLAQDTLQDFLEEHDRLIIRARNAVGAAENALDFAQAPLTAFLRSPSRDLQADGKPVDVAELNRLQASVDLAQANLDKAREDLAELEAGPDPLRVQQLESNITVAELNLTEARDALAELEEGPDPVLLQQLESAVTVAELNLEQANENLVELEAGPDILVLNQLQAQVELARVNVDQATKNLNEAMEGPDPLIVSGLELNVTLAQRRLDLAERNLQELLDEGPNRDTVPLMELEMATRLAQIDQLYEGPDTVQLSQIDALNAQIDLARERLEDIEEEMGEYSLYSPSAGYVFLVNVEEEDLVSKHSRVIGLLDPSEVVVQGYVDASDFHHFAIGASAAIEIASLSGHPLAGTVVYVAEDPRTERGVISHAVEIQVDLPPDVEVPPRLAAVDAVILP